MSNSLYPLKFKPILKDKIWGGSRLRQFPGKEEASEKCGESWDISAFENEITTVAEGFLQGNNLQELIEIYMGDLTGDKIFEQNGLEFPLLIKFIETADILSVQVHPDDEMALSKHNLRGKTEMWYIVDTIGDAGLISGFNREISREEYVYHLNAGKISEILNYVRVRKGDVFFVPPGRIHAIGPGILLTEIQQASDLTYRVFDWNRKDENGNLRPLHTELALEALDFNYYPDVKSKYETKLNASVEVVDNINFTTNIIHLDKVVEKNYSFIDSFVIYICTEGEVILNVENLQSTTLMKGETVLIPAVIKQLVVIPLKRSTLLEVYIK